LKDKNLFNLIINYHKSIVFKPETFVTILFLKNLSKNSQEENLWTWVEEKGLVVLVHHLFSFWICNLSDPSIVVVDTL